jgi:hypothetical protein
VQTWRVENSPDGRNENPKKEKRGRNNDRK